MQGHNDPINGDGDSNGGNDGHDNYHDNNNDAKKIATNGHGNNINVNNLYKNRNSKNNEHHLHPFLLLFYPTSLLQIQCLQS